MVLDKLRALALVALLCAFLPIPSGGGNPNLYIAGVGPGTGTGTDDGISDASLEDNTSVGVTTYMSYTGVEPILTAPSLLHNAITTRLAHTSDNGVTFTDDGVVAVPSSQFGSGVNSTTWNSEVSTLTNDPGANAGEQFKLMTFRYMMVDGVLNPPLNSWLSYKTAATVDGLASATEQKLFATSSYSSTNNSTGAPNFSPVGGAPLITINNLDASLDCIALTEPGFTSTSGAVYLVFACINAGGDRKIELIKCAAPCTATSQASWTYLGLLLDDTAAAHFGAIHFNAADIFFVGATAFLLVSPVLNIPTVDAYAGCLLFQFANIDTASLVMSGGFPQAFGVYNGVIGSFNGACTMQHAISAVLYDQVSLPLGGLRPFFMIRRLPGF